MRNQAKQDSGTVAVSFGERAYQQIKYSIMAGRFAPGQILTAPELAKMHEMSTTPIFGALKLLTSDGLVEVVPRVGYRVTGVTMEDVRDIFELRLDLEPLAVQLAAERAADSALAAIEALAPRTARQLHESLRSRKRMVETMLEANASFHLQIAALSGNRMLVEAIERCLDRSGRLYVLDASVQAMVRHVTPIEQVPDLGPHEEHQLIVSALKARDGRAARVAMANHITATRDRVIDSLVAVGRGSAGLAAVGVGLPQS